MANSRLVTEVRVNKNGVPVKKHVLPENTGKMSTSAIPQPGLSSKNVDRKNRERLFSCLDLESKNPAYEKRVRDAIDGMPKELVCAAQDQLDRFSDSSRVVSGVESAIMKLEPGNEEVGKKFIAALEVEALYDRYWEKSPLGNPLRYAAIVGSVTAHVESETENDPSLANMPPEEERALNYFVAASDLYMRTSDERFRSYHEATCLLEYPELVGVFREFPDRAAELAEYVIENGRDAGRARQHMRNDPLVFADGAL